MDLNYRILPFMWEKGVGYLLMSTAVVNLNVHPFK